MHYPNKFLSLGGVGQIGNTGRWSGAGCTSSGGTPTNPTPPDSITEEVYGAAGASGALQSHLYFFYNFSYVDVKIVYSGHLPVTVNPFAGMMVGHNPPQRSDSGFVSGGPNRVRFSPSPFEPAGSGGPGSGVAPGQGIVMQTDWSPTHPAAVEPLPAAR